MNGSLSQAKSENRAEIRRGLRDQLTRCEARVLAEVCAALSRAEERARRNAEDALAQLDAGLYRYCLTCHCEIPVERLAALAFAVRCVECDQVLV